MASVVGFILTLFVCQFYVAWSQGAAALRLTTDVKPSTYDLYLHPHLHNDTFVGRVSIVIDVSSKQRAIKLHQKDLVISSVTLSTHGEYNVEIEECYSNDESEILTVKLNEELDVGRYRLNLSFSGRLDDRVHGFYSSRYVSEDHETRIIATTHFEPTRAREAFPCFDEPSFKAEFSVRVVYPSDSGYHALSNMDVVTTAVDDPTPGYSTVSFAKTPPMSTYLVCFVVSDLVSTTKEARRSDDSKIPVNVYTRRAQRERGKFALDTAVRIVEYYNRLFDIDFPLSKMDIVAVPDLSSHAMENWGLITYKDKYLLYDKRTSPTSSKLWTVQTIAHEFAHMWFGNLVTMKWWNELWLSEGLASFFQFRGADAMFPDSGYMDAFLKIVHTALYGDATVQSRPIVAQSAADTSNIAALFDSVSYHKEPAVLRMLEGFVGSEAFISGLRMYLKKFAYKNADTENLFDCIRSVSGNDVNVNDIMDTWIRQMGFPVVNVQRDKLTYTLTQKRFLETGAESFNPSESPFGYRWTIPITYTTSKNSTPTLVWFDKDKRNLVVTLKEPVDWIKFNDRQVGFYRVNYDKKDWKSLIVALRKNHEQFPVHDRAHLLEDAFSLAEAGQLNFATALSLTLYLYNEVDYMPWYVTALKLKTLGQRLTNSKTSKKLNNYVKNIVDKVYITMRWNINDDDPTNKLTTILDLACSVGHTKCLKDAGDVFKAWINDAQDVRPHPDVRETVYKYGMKQVGNETDWDIMFLRFTAEKDADERKRMMEGLINVNTDSTHTLNKTLNLIFDQRYFGSEETYKYLHYFNPHGIDFVWDWVQENWEHLAKRYHSGELLYETLFPYFCVNFANKAKLDQTENFFLRHPEQAKMRAYREYAEEFVGGENEWFDDNLIQVDRWLDALQERI